MYYFYLAQAYGEGVYGDERYGVGGSSGQLADTGIWIVAAITLASLIIFAALLVRFWKRKPKTPSSSEKSVETSDDEQ